jgi:hypothetical protein
VPARTRTQPQAKYCRDTDLSFQGTLHKYLVQRGQGIPTPPMGQTPQTGRTYTQHAPDMTHDTISFSICVPLGQTQYNSNPFTLLGCKVEAHVTPGNQETWAPHTASSFYIGNAWEHYRCHKIYICDTKHTRTCLTAFFKHKYLTMPTINPSNAFICMADYLTYAFLGLIPAPTCMQDAVNQLMIIFKQQAHTANDAATTQGVLREQVQAERLIKEGAKYWHKHRGKQRHCTPPKVSLKSRRTKMMHPHLQTRKQ